MFGRIYLLVLFLLLLLLQACSKQSDLQQIQITINHMEHALENKQLSAFMSHVAEDFSGQQGQYNQQKIQQMLQGVLLVNNTVTLLITSDKTELVSSSRANSSISVLALGSSSWLPEKGRNIHLEIGWKKVDQQWVVNHVTWSN